MQPLNFSAQAVKDLKQFKASWDKIPGHTETVKTMDVLIKALDNAVKFILPLNGTYFHKNGFTDADAQLFRLPYPSIAAEFETDLEMIDSKYSQILVNKRIALAFEFDKFMDLPENIIEQFRLSLIDTYENIDENHISAAFIWPIDYVAKINKWVPSWVGVFVPYTTSTYTDPAGSLSKIKKELNYACIKERPQELQGIRSIGVLLGEYGAIYENHLKETGKLVEAAMWQDTGIESNAIIHLCAMLNCDNISTTTVRQKQPMVFKNKKKSHKPKKSAFYEYKVLNLDLPKMEKTAGTNLSIVGRTSPKTHLRRGHIRHYKPGKTTWVNAAVINPNAVGKLDKDYKVTYRQEGTKAA